MNKSFVQKFLLLLLAAAFSLGKGHAYSVLTHEQIIDLAWKDSIRPLLLSRYPNTTEAELKDAHAYAYGGCAIQDAGYYPFGHATLSDLTHYVRSGDFVANLIRDSRNVNELAFALGALSHYIGDSIGHHDAVNPSTAVEFPKLKAEYGPVVTYDESPHAHVRTEFAFDIDQLSKKRIAPSAYWKHEGLKVPIHLMERAFYETYGLRLRSMVLNESAAFGTYRWSVRTFLPTLAHGEVLLHRKDFPPDTPGPEFDEYAKRLAEADFNNGWEQYRKKAGIKTHLVATLIVITPKVGVLSDLAIRGPQASTEEKYVESVNRTVTRYDAVLDSLTQHPKASPRLTMNLENIDLDTGEKAIPGTYRLMDEAYAKLLDRIVRVKDPIPVNLKLDIQAYYSDPNAPISTKKHPRAWRKVQQQLTILESMPVIPERDVPALLAQTN